MPTPLQIPIKYCKSLIASGSAIDSSTFTTPNHVARFLDKLLYEFWGFCVNGTSDLVRPGGLASVSYPVGFESGSNVLLANGTDGTTTFGTDIFSSPSTDFTTINSGSLIGKYLVTWVPGQDSTDDSVYFIKSVEDASHLRVDIHNGGTRRLGNHPWFWDRNNINWRIVDIAGAAFLTGWQDGHNMVLDLVAAPTVNPGQAVSQVQYFHRTGSNGSEGTVGLVFSPGGTWNGTGFTDGTPEDQKIWFGKIAEGTGGNKYRGSSLYTFVGGGDFLIGEARSLGPPEDPTGPQAGMTAGSGFHIEVPKRLYTLSADPNPLAWLTWSNLTPNQVAASYYNGFSMVSLDTNVHTWTTLVRSPHGTQIRPDYTGNAYGTGQWQQFGLPAFRFAFMSFDQEDDSYLTTDGVLSLSTPGQFSLSRVRLRHVRFSTSDLKSGARLGDPVTNPRGWVHVANGIFWPWDNSILPEGPWRFGV